MGGLLPPLTLRPGSALSAWGLSAGSPRPSQPTAPGALSTDTGLCLTWLPAGRGATHPDPPPAAKRHSVAASRGAARALGEPAGRQHSWGPQWALATVPATGCGPRCQARDVCVPVRAPPLRPPRVRAAVSCVPEAPTCPRPSGHLCLGGAGRKQGQRWTTRSGRGEGRRACPLSALPPAPPRQAEAQSPHPRRPWGGPSPATKSGLGRGWGA